jgi:hypothetical protein
MPTIRSLVVLAMLAVPFGLVAQEKPTPPADEPMPQAGGAPVPVRVQLVLSRFDGEKKISSMPYTLQMIANDRQSTSLRMGVEVPVATGSAERGVSYRSIGTKIDSRVTTSPGGGFRLTVIMTEDSIRMTEDQKTAMGVASPSMPAFRNFSGNFTILLRDGQAAQYTTATDPVSGEVLKVDATLTVLK